MIFTHCPISWSEVLLTGSGEATVKILKLNLVSHWTEPRTSSGTSYLMFSLRKGPSGEGQEAELAPEVSSFCGSTLTPSRADLVTFSQTKHKFRRGIFNIYYTVCQYLELLGFFSCSLKQADEEDVHLIWTQVTGYMLRRFHSTPLGI